MAEVDTMAVVIMAVVIMAVVIVVVGIMAAGTIMAVALDIMVDTLMVDTVILAMATMGMVAGTMVIGTLAVAAGGMAAGTHTVSERVGVSDQLLVGFGFATNIKAPARKWPNPSWGLAISWMKEAMTEAWGRLRIDVVNHQIIVSLPGTNYSVTYFKQADLPQLLAKRIANADDLRVPITVSEFLARAWRVANDKARELGWVA